MIVDALVLFAEGTKMAQGWPPHRKVVSRFMDDFRGRHEVWTAPLHAGQPFKLLWHLCYLWHPKSLKKLNWEVCKLLSHFLKAPVFDTNLRETTCSQFDGTNLLSAMFRSDLSLDVKAL